MTPPGGMRGLIGRWLGDPASPAAPLPEFALPTGEGPLVWMRIGAGHGQSAADETALPPTLTMLPVPPPPGTWVSCPQAQPRRICSS